MNANYVWHFTQQLHVFFSYNFLFALQFVWLTATISLMRCTRGIHKWIILRQRIYFFMNFFHVALNSCKNMERCAYKCNTHTHLRSDLTPLQPQNLSRTYIQSHNKKISSRKICVLKVFKSIQLWVNRDRS